jgi:DNA-binding beta-propeller fold protein YncE
VEQKLLRMANMKQKIEVTVWTAAAALLLAAGCGETSANGDFTSGSESWAGADAGSSPGAPGTGGMGGSGGSGVMDGGVDAAAPEPPPLPPEIEQIVEFELPKAGERYVFAPNPESNSVAIIDATNYGVRTEDAGEKPTFLQTIGETDAAIVLDVAKDNAWIIRAAPMKVTKNSVEVVEGANAIAVSPDGKHAVVYVNYRRSDTETGSGNYQKVTIITLSEQRDTAVDMTVGFRPYDVSFTEDGSRGFVITEYGVSILDFARIDDGTDEIARLVELGYTPDEIPSDVSVTSDGRYALARLENASLVHLVDLDTKEIKALDLVTGEIVKPQGDRARNAGGAVDFDDAGQPEPPEPDVVTDLDLSPDGRFAVAVLRSQGKVLRIPVPEAFDKPSRIVSTEIENVIIGSVTIAADSRHALLYTTADPPPGTSATDLRYIERISVLDLTGKDALKIVQLEKAIAAVAISPDSATAFIIHKRQEVSAETPGSPNANIDLAYGYSLLKLSTGDRMLQTSETPVGRFAIVPDGTYLFILFRDDSLGIKDMHHVSLPRLQPKVIPLERPPVSVGVVPRVKRVFVGQEHADGLITFFDWDTARSQAVTGFERNSRIEELE